MISALLDTNIYDILKCSPETCARIRTLVEAGSIEIIVSRTVEEELLKSPFAGIPDFFPIKYVGNTVARVGLLCAGDSIGSGEVFDAHLGNSNKLNDALVVDAASWHADWLVSEDKRLRKQMEAQEVKCKPMGYEEFVAQLPE